MKGVYMADNKETKPKSFKIDDETADRFKEISVMIGGNQQVAMSKLIEAFEFQSGKAVLTEKRSDIEQFEKYVNALTRMFMGSLEENQIITETVRTEFDALLKSKDITIQDLQEKLTVAKQLKEDAIIKAKTFADENMHLNGTIESLTNEYTGKLSDMQEALKDKTDLTDNLRAFNMELRNKLEAMQQEHEQFKVVFAELDALKHTHEQLEKGMADLQRSNSDMHKQLDRDSKEYEKILANQNKEYEKALADQKQHEVDALERLREQAEFTQDKAILEIEKKHHEQMEKLKGQIELTKDQKQAEVDKYQQKYLVLLEQIKNQAKAKTIND